MMMIAAQKSCDRSRRLASHYIITLPYLVFHCHQTAIHLSSDHHCVSLMIHNCSMKSEYTTEMKAPGKLHHRDMLMPPELLPLHSFLHIMTAAPTRLSSGVSDWQIHAVGRVSSPRHRCWSFLPLHARLAFHSSCWPLVHDIAGRLNDPPPTLGVHDVEKYCTPQRLALSCYCKAFTTLRYY